MFQLLRRSFVTGLVVTVRLVVSVVAIVWTFQFADRLTGALGEQVIGAHVPGLGLVTTMLIVLAAGAIASNVIGRRIVRRGEALLMQVPVFCTISASVKQLL